MSFHAETVHKQHQEGGANIRVVEEGEEVHHWENAQVEGIDGRLRSIVILKRRWGKSVIDLIFSSHKTSHMLVAMNLRGDLVEDDSSSQPQNKINSSKVPNAAKWGWLFLLNLSGGIAGATGASEDWRWSSETNIAITGIDMSGHIGQWREHANAHEIQSRKRRDFGIPLEEGKRFFLSAAHLKYCKFAQN